MSPNKVDSDFWGHVQYGFDTVDHGLAKTSTYSYTSEGYRWINHENLSEIIFGVLLRHLGSQSVLVLKCLFGCIVIGLILNRCLRKQVSVSIVASVLVLVAINLSYFWGVRPQFFSFTFFAVLIFIYETRLTPESLEKLSKFQRILTAILVGILLAIWTNTHGGFLAGVGVFGMLMFFQLIRHLVFRRWNMVFWYLLYGIVAFGVTLVNPYGVQLHLWLIESLRVPRPEIHEWHPPNFLASQSIKIWVLLMAIVIGIVASRKRRDWVTLMTLGFVVTQALSHQRHLPFVAILFGFWLPEHLDDVMSRWAGPAQSFKSNIGTRSLRYVSIAFACLSLIFAIQVGARLQEIMVSTSRYPVDAIQFMHDHNLQGRTIVTGEWAQYLLYVLGARNPGESGCRVAFDGRFRTCYPQTVIDLHFDFFEPDTDPNVRYRSPDSPPIDPPSILRVLSPELVLLKNDERFPISVLRKEPTWNLLYRDSTAQLWGNNGRNKRFSASRFDQRMNRIPHRYVPWPAGPKADQTTRFVTKEDDST